jgi:hypothetical protein
MATTPTLIRRALVPLAGAALLLSACGGGVIEEADVEASVAAELAAQLDQPEPNIDCPGDLKAEVGATMECELTVDGDDETVLPVAVKVKSIEDGTANYSVEVGEPKGGSDTSSDDEPLDEAPAEDEELEDAPAE